MAHLLAAARTIQSVVADTALVDDAVRALLARHRAGQTDATYAAYDDHPTDEPDEFENLSSWRRAAGAS